jgi:hypothetical protein
MYYNIQHMSTTLQYISTITIHPSHKFASLTHIEFAQLKLSQHFKIPHHKYNIVASTRDNLL